MIRSVGCLGKSKILKKITYFIVLALLAVLALSFECAHATAWAGNAADATDAAQQKEEQAAPASASTEDIPMIEIRGADAYETGAQAALKAYPDGAMGVVVVSGESFPDGLAAAGLAGLLDYPILATARESLPAATRDAIKQLEAEEVYVIGGQAVISLEVEESLSDISGHLTRIAGANRYETAAAIYEMGRGIGSWGDTAIVTAGEECVYAHIASAYAFAACCPILLTTSDGSLSDATAYALREGGFDEVIIVGNQGKVPTGTEADIVRIVDGSCAVERIAGATQYETASALAWFSIENGFVATNPVVAPADAWGIMKGAAVLAGKTGNVLLLADEANASSAAWFLEASLSQVENLQLVGMDEDATRALKVALGQEAATDISAAEIAPVGNLVYDGTDQKPHPAVTLYGRQLTEGTDFTFEYTNNKDAGTASITVRGRGSCTGTASGSFVIAPAPVTVEARDSSRTTAEENPVFSADVTGTFGTDTVQYTLSCEAMASSGPGAYAITAAGQELQGNYRVTFSAGVLTVEKAVQRPEPGAVTVSGQSRYDTAAEIARTAYPQGADGVVVATGASFPDALAASSLAGLLDYPVVLTEPDALTASAAEAIETLGAKHAVIVGGTGAVSSDVESALARYGKVTRIAGQNRFETAYKIYQAGLGYGTWSRTAILTTGSNYPDALSISSYAFANTSPIFLVDSEAGIPADATSALIGGGFDRVVVLGGDSAVPGTALEPLRAGGVQTSRIYGQDRYATSKAIAVFTISQGGTAEGACIATGGNFPDALAGGVLAGMRNSIMLLACETDMSTFDVLRANKKSITGITFLGGETAVPVTVREAAKDAVGMS